MKIDPAERRAVEELLSAYAWRVDHDEIDGLGGLFTEDGGLVTPGFEIWGPAAIEAAFRARAARGRRITRQVWSNLRLERLDPERIRARSIVQSYAHEGPDSPAPVTALMVGDAIDDIRRGPDGRWRFAVRRLEVAFEQKG